MRRIVVTGATGWIGRQVCRHATALGMKVIAIGRSAASTGPWSVYCRCDITDDRLFEHGQAVTGAEALIHCAGYAHRGQETTDDLAKFDLINHEGTGRILKFTRQAGVARVVYASSIAFYDWPQGCDFDEEGPVNPQTAYARSKLAGERLVCSSGLDWRVSRLATVFGEGDKANFARLARLSRERRLVIPGSGSARKSLLPVSMAAELLVDLGTRPDLAGCVVNLALPHNPTLAEICHGLSDACGFPRARAVPLPVLELGARLGDVVARIKPEFPLTTATLRKLTTNTTVATGRMESCWPARRWPTFLEALAASALYYRNA